MLDETFRIINPISGRERDFFASGPVRSKKGHLCGSLFKPYPVYCTLILGELPRTINPISGKAPNLFSFRFAETKKGYLSDPFLNHIRFLFATIIGEELGIWNPIFSKITKNGHFFDDISWFSWGGLPLKSMSLQVKTWLFDFNGRAFSRRCNKKYNV